MNPEDRQGNYQWPGHPHPLYSNPQGYYHNYGGHQFYEMAAPQHAPPEPNGVADNLDEWFYKENPVPPQGNVPKVSDEPNFCGACGVGPVDYEDGVCDECQNYKNPEMDYDEPGHSEPTVTQVCAGCGRAAIGVRHGLAHCENCRVVPRPLEYHVVPHQMSPGQHRIPGGFSRIQHISDKRIPIEQGPSSSDSGYFTSEVQEMPIRPEGISYPIKERRRVVPESSISESNYSFIPVRSSDTRAHEVVQRDYDSEEARCVEERERADHIIKEVLDELSWKSALESTTIEDHPVAPCSRGYLEPDQMPIEQDPSSPDSSYLNSDVQETWITPEEISDIVEEPRPVVPKTAIEKQLPKPNYPFNPGFSLCTICGVTAIGFKFGLLSCGICEQFFRRFHSQNLETLPCKFEKNCEISKKIRSKCAHCHLKKCRLFGMKPNGYTDERKRVNVWKNDKLAGARCAEERARTDDNMKQLLKKLSLNFVLELMPINNHPMIEKLSKAFQKSCLYTEFKMKTLQLQEKQKSRQPASRVISWQIYMENMEKDLLATVPLIGVIDEKLESNEKSILWKRNAFSVYILRCARGFHGKGFILSDGRRFHPDTLQWIYCELTEEIQTICKEILEMKLDDGETAILIALIIFQPTFRDNEELIKIIHEDYRKLLFQKLLSRRKGIATILKVVSLIPQLNSMNERHYKLLDYLRLEYLIFEIPPVFAEIYDICKK